MGGKAAFANACSVSHETKRRGMFYFGHKDVECKAFDPTSGPCRGHFAREVAANEETRVERRMRKKRNAIVVDTWDLSEEEEEYTLPTKVDDSAWKDLPE